MSGTQRLDANDDTDRAALEVAADALLTRVRWYTVRSHRVPAPLVRSFNRIADALGLPDSGPWRRLVMRPPR